jgi:hypothetical protein
MVKALRMGMRLLGFRLALCKEPNRVGVSLHNLKTETDPVSKKNIVFWLFNIPDDDQNP